MDTYFVFEYIFLVVGECLSTFFDGGGDDILEFGCFAHNYNIDYDNLFDQKCQINKFRFSQYNLFFVCLFKIIVYY